MSQHANIYTAPATDNIRDAIHIPIISGVAGSDMLPGIPVKHSQTFNRWYACEWDEMQGICNPFNPECSPAGSMIWVMISPMTVTDLKHVWTHPMFADPAASPVTAEEPTPEQIAASETWLRNFCSTADCPEYEVMMAAAVGDPISSVDSEYYGTYDITSWGDGDSYLHFDGRDAHGEIPPEFWDHVELVTGRKCPARPQRFSCSC